MGNQQCGEKRTVIERRDLIASLPILSFLVVLLREVQVAQEFRIDTLHRHRALLLRLVNAVAMILAVLIVRRVVLRLGHRCVFDDFVC